MSDRRNHRARVRRVLADALEPRRLLADFAQLAGSDLRITGTNQADTITVTRTSNPAGDLIVATLNGESLTFAQSAVRRVFIDGEAGKDSITVAVRANVRGGQSNDTIRGSAKDDTLYGGEGQDQIFGGSGDDTIDGYDDADSVYGEAGNDVLGNFRGGADLLDGGRGNDTIVPLSGDTSRGQAGDDAITLTDAGSVSAGSGRDTAVLGNSYTVSFDGVANDGRLGDNDMLLNVGNDFEVVQGSSQRDIIDLSGATHGIDVFSNGGDDTVTGSDFADSLDGGSGDDTITGGDGEDVLRGSDGNDTLVGNAGPDSFNGGRGNDRIDAADGEVDLVNGSSNTDRGFVDGNDTVSNLELQGTGGILIGVAGRTIYIEGDDTAHTVSVAYTGGQLVADIDGESVTASTAQINTIFVATGAGADSITIDTATPASVTAGAGNDTITGGSGTDSLFGEAGNDLITGNSNEGGANSPISNDREFLEGGDGNDILNGSAGNDYLNGGLGNDSMTGGSGGDFFNSVEAEDGDDTMLGNTGSDQFFDFDGAANDTDLIDGGDGDDSVDYTDATAVPNPAGLSLTLDSVANDGAAGENDNLLSLTRISGSLGDDLIVGTDANEDLDGSGGNDTLRGNGGNDSLTGGQGADSLEGGGGNDTFDSRAGEDQATTADTLRGGTGTDDAIADYLDILDSIETSDVTPDPNG